jgi:hypothetical protein
MKNSAFAARSHIRNIVLCSLLTFGLAACGAGEGSSSGTASTVSDSIPSLVAPNVGMIDRGSEADVPSVSDTAETNVAANTTQSATPVSSTAPTSSSTTVTSIATPASATVPTTVASNNNTSTNSSTPTNPTSSSTGTATLDWMPPTENSDGSVLTNLAGYTVYYGTSPSNLTQSVKITNPGLSAYTMTTLPSGTWYFAVTAYSSTGIESARSGVVSTTI